MVAGHKASVHKGKRRCKKCGRRHSVSVHWSHTHGPHKGAHGETAWFGRKARPQGKRKIRKPAKRKARRSKSGTVIGKIRVTRAKRLPRRTAAQMIAMGRAASKHRVKGHLAKTPGSSKKHRVADHLAKNPTKRRKGGKKPRSAAQKAATARMLAGLAAKRAGRKASVHSGMRVTPSHHTPAGIPMHHVRGHLAKKPHSRKKHLVKAHMAAEPGFGGLALTKAERAHNRALARRLNRKSKH